MAMKRKTGRFTKFGRTIHPKNVIVPLLNAYWKNLEKLVQWIEDLVQVGRFLQKKNMGLIKSCLLTGRAKPYAFSTKKNCQTNRNQSVI